MRISDWSSDVCSSDLATLQQALQQEGGIGSGTAAGIVGGIGDHHRALVVADRPGQRRIDVEIVRRRRAAQGVKLATEFFRQRSGLGPIAIDRKSTRLNSSP